ncbi:citrinin biosynthesis oxidoreductase-like protein CtnB [Phaeosphaeria sp. MPI-PUGE-AT-0046c]|nr:citrinin biosynthesis oxidoreductase-like protein CtnB [Phaeosphaeria sp. MPI-PUGE-AT-0046c]
MASDTNATYLTPSEHPQGVQSSRPVKPTVLAFHGSGSNATIHTVQLARLKRFTQDHFEIASLEAPFPSPAGPGILPFFDGCGPFKRWLPPSEKVSLESMRSGTSTSLLPPEVEAQLRTRIQSVRGCGGRVIGLIGFSQGTKVVAGLLRASELRKELGLLEEDWCDFEFGVSVCGSYPPPLVPGWVGQRLGEGKEVGEEKIATPTFHVQGKQDEWLWAGNALIENYYEVGEGKSERVEWDMGHHYPVAQEDNEKMAEWMIGVLRKVEARREAR